MSFLSEMVLGGRGEQKALDFTEMSYAGMLSGAVKSGVEVTVKTALRVSTAFGCGRVISEDVGKLPFRLMRETPKGGRIAATDHPLYWLLYRRPNDWMTSQQFRETLTLHAVFCQFGCAYINRSSDGRPLELLPLMPGSVTVRQDTRTREVAYEVQDNNGIVGVFPRRDILHLDGISWNTIEGMVLVKQAREVLGLSLAIEGSQARLHANGARPSGILTTDKTLLPAARTRLERMFADGFSGMLNSGKVPVLDDGIKFIAAAMSSIDAETLASRMFQIEEVCRMFRVYPQKVMHADKAATYAAAEQTNIAHGTDTIDPWAQRWCHSVGRDCLTMEEIKAGLYPVMPLQALMRGDNASRATFYKAAIGTASSPGWMSPDDIRRLEDQDPVGRDGSDEIVTWRRFSGKGTSPTEAGAPADGTDSALPAIDGATVVQDTALNGAQVQSLQAIVAAAANGQLPVATARAMILAAFPAISDQVVDDMLKGLDSFTPTAPAATKAGG